MSVLGDLTQRCEKRQPSCFRDSDIVGGNCGACNYICDALKLPELKRGTNLTQQMSLCVSLTRRDRRRQTDRQTGCSYHQGQATNNNLLTVGVRCGYA